MRPCAVMDVDPSDCYQLLPDAVPVPRTRDDFDVSRASPIPGHHEAGARGRVRHDRLRGRAWRAFHTRASHGAARATKPGGLTGAVPCISPNNELELWKPAYDTGQEEPGQMCRRVMACPTGLSPVWAAGPKRPTPGGPRASSRTAT
jgi:hypothetical protein